MTAAQEYIPPMWQRSSNSKEPCWDMSGCAIHHHWLKTPQQVLCRREIAQVMREWKRNGWWVEMHRQAPLRWTAFQTSQPNLAIHQPLSWLISSCEHCGVSFTPQDFKTSKQTKPFGIGVPWGTRVHFLTPVLKTGVQIQTQAHGCPQQKGLGDFHSKALNPSHTLFLELKQSCRI